MSKSTHEEKETGIKARLKRMIWIVNMIGKMAPLLGFGLSMILVLGPHWKYIVRRIIKNATTGGIIRDHDCSHTVTPRSIVFKLPHH